MHHKYSKSRCLWYSAKTLPGSPNFCLSSCASYFNSDAQIAACGSAIQQQLCHYFCPQRTIRTTEYVQKYFFSYKNTLLLFGESIHHSSSEQCCCSKTVLLRSFFYFFLFFFFGSAKIFFFVTPNVEVGWLNLFYFSCSFLYFIYGYLPTSLMSLRDDWKQHQSWYVPSCS